MVIVSEFGFAPHWQRIEGPRIIDPIQYYHIPEDVGADSPEADIQRQYIIKGQIAVFCAKPFIAAALFWDYRGAMGVVDDHGLPRPSWRTLQEEFSPLVIEKVDFTFPKKDQCKVNIALRRRGPIEVDLPVYTLCNYRINWELMSSTGKSPNKRGEAELPVLPSGINYDLCIDVPWLVERCKLHIAVFRPTGFVVSYRDFFYERELAYE